MIGILVALAVLLTSLFLYFRVRNHNKYEGNWWKRAGREEQEMENLGKKASKRSNGESEESLVDWEERMDREAERREREFLMGRTW